MTARIFSGVIKCFLAEYLIRIVINIILYYIKTPFNRFSQWIFRTTKQRDFSALRIIELHCTIFDLDCLIDIEF